MISDFFILGLFEIKESNASIAKIQTPRKPSGAPTIQTSPDENTIIEAMIIAPFLEPSNAIIPPITPQTNRSRFIIVRPPGSSPLAISEKTPARNSKKLETRKTFFTGNDFFILIQFNVLPTLLKDFRHTPSFFA
jgi:hypothetical protein